MLSWKPKRQGDRYCAPACGRGCTMKEYEEASVKGGALATRLGQGWTVRIWENLGWHYAVQSPCQRIRIHPNIYWKTRKVESYTAFLGERNSSGGKWAEHGKTPEAAMRNVIRVAKADLDALSAALHGL